MDNRQAQQSSSNVMPQKGLSPSQQGILALNSMSYRMEPDLSIVIQRNVQATYFQNQDAAPGATLTAILQTGSCFVNLRQSSLVLDVQNQSINASAGGAVSGANSSPAWFGTNGGSACNLISRIMLTSKNGTLIERIDNCNVLSAIKVNYKYDDSWRHSVGSLMGVVMPAGILNSGTSTTATVSQTETAQSLGWLSASDGATADSGAITRFVIPLYVFSTFCDSLGSLAPPQLMAGMKVEILLENPANAMMDASPGAAGINNKILNYHVVACRLDLESYLLTDSVQTVLNEEASSRGLDVVSATTVDTQAQRTNNTISVDVSRSCSRALSVVYKERVLPVATNIAYIYGGGAFFDPMASAVYGSSLSVSYPQEFQCRAGSLYYPQSSIRGSNALTATADLFAQTLRAFQKLNVGGAGENAGAGTSLYQFKGSLTTAANVTGLNATAAGPSTTPIWPTVQGGRAVFALDLQRSAILVSGLPLTNARQLNLLYTNNTSNGGPFQVDVYLTYEVVVRCFNTQVSLDI